MEWSGLRNLMGQCDLPLAKPPVNLKPDAPHLSMRETRSVRQFLLFVFR